MINKIQKKKIKNSNIRKVNSVFQKDTNYDILGLICALIVAVLSIKLTPPNTKILWLLKGVEFAGIAFAGYAIGSLINKFVKNKEVIKEKVRLETKSNKKRMSLRKFLHKNLESIGMPITMWANMNDIACNYLKYSNFRHTINFHNFPVDYIDIQIIDYHLFFIVRLHEEDYIQRLFHFLISSEIKLALTLDSNHLGPQNKIKINEDSIEKLKTTLLDNILNPAHTIISF
jgi:hypothetical protein